MGNESKENGEAGNCEPGCEGRIYGFKGGGSASIAQGVFKVCEHMKPGREMELLLWALGRAIDSLTKESSG